MAVINPEELSLFAASFILSTFTSLSPLIFSNCLRGVICSPFTVHIPAPFNLFTSAAFIPCFESSVISNIVDSAVSSSSLEAVADIFVLGVLRSMLKTYGTPNIKTRLTF
eukprot:NODE_913_length_3117_cov_0.441352.p4 type:complete len:110 gc:universal NODE_913_length_3117_cov_0.441352:518-189(-)